MSEVDQRITLAREYLAGVRQHDVLRMLPSALMREAAESRRQLGIVLDVIGEAMTAADRATMLAALVDAARWRDHLGAADCDDCTHAPAGLCGRHDEDLAAADGYRRLLAGLSGQS
jgi:hypothetical protein